MSLEDNRKYFLTFFNIARAFDTVRIDDLFKQVFGVGIIGNMWRLVLTI